MPCRDYGAEREFSEEQRKRLDALAQEACEAGTIAYILMKQLFKVVPSFNVIDLGTKNAVLLNKVLDRYTEHRVCDKKAAKEDAINRLRVVTQTIQKIRELGGEPVDELLVKHAQVQNEIMAIDRSDIFNTELY